MQTRTQHDYFEAALELMAGAGAAGVTIAALCERLGVTKGSFYHHFDSVDVFMSGLLAYWEQEYGARLGRQAMTIVDPAERLVALREMSVELHHEAESAIRAFARSNPAAATILERVDAARIEVTRRTLVELGLDEQTSTLLAQMVVSMLVGMQHLAHQIDRATMNDVFRQYQLLVTTAASAMA